MTVRRSWNPESVGPDPKVSVGVSMLGCDASQLRKHPHGCGCLDQEIGEVCVRYCLDF